MEKQWRLRLYHVSTTPIVTLHFSGTMARFMGWLNWVLWGDIIRYSVDKVKIVEGSERSENLRMLGSEECIMPES